MPSPNTYKGSCHCGNVRFEVNADLSSVLACNCSICSRVGALLSFVPSSEFKLLAGDDAVTDYQFNKNVIHHLFCRTCGVRSFARGTGPGGQEMVAVNVRCLEGVDPNALEVKHFDGKSL